MDSQHRHELKENDLAEFLTNFGEWWSKHGKSLLITALVVGLGLGGYRMFKTKSSMAHENAWNDLATTSSPEAFRILAQEHGDPAVRALAYRNAADLLLAAARVPTEIPEQNEKMLVEAKQLYQKLLEQAPHKVYKLNAMIGLANVAESRKQWDEAAETWQSTLQLASDEYPVITAQAKHRLEFLDRLKVPVFLAPDPLPEISQPENSTDELDLTFD